MGEPAFDFRQLTVAERLQLVEDIWDSIAQDAPATQLPLSDGQRAELRQSLAEDAADPTAAIPWDEVRKDLFGRGG